MRVVISSATLQADSFLKFFESRGEAEKKARRGEDVTHPTEEGDNGKDPRSGHIVSIEGRTYPIDMFYLQEPTENYLQRAVTTILDIHQKEDPGDILVFLTGRDEIETAVELINELDQSSYKTALMPLPLYAGLSTEQQMYIFDKAPQETRKVVFATNIAEASVTIDGVVYIVDCGFAKMRIYDPKTGIESLSVEPISKASAKQRAGRAGRTKSGKCYRLYTEEAYKELPETTTPELIRSNLASVFLLFKALGIDNVARFPYLSPPPSSIVIRSLELLYALGALDDYAKLTRPLGYQMAELGVLEPMLAKTLLAAPKFACLSEMLSIAALMSVGGGNTIWFYHEGERKRMEERRRRFMAEEGDHLTLLNAFEAFSSRKRKGDEGGKWCHENSINFKVMTKVVSVRNQLKGYLEKFNIVEAQTSSLPSDTTQLSENIRRCIATGYFSNAAKMQADGSFLNVERNVTFHIHPSSVLFNRKTDWVVYHECLQTGGGGWGEGGGVKKEGKIYIRDLTKVDLGWLLEYGKGFYEMKGGERG